MLKPPGPKTTINNVPPEYQEAILDKLWRLRWGVDRSLIYYRRRHHFITNLDGTLEAITWLLGTGVVLGIVIIIKDSADYKALGWTLSLTLPVIAVACGIFRKIFDLKRKADAFTKKIGEFSKIKMELDAESKLTLERLEFLGVERIKSETDDEATKVIIDALCHNEMIRRHNLPKEQEIEVGFLQGIFGHFLNFDDAKLKRHHTGKTV